MEDELRRGRRVVRFSHLDRVWWPEEGLRKRDVVEYYRAIAPVLLPHVADRPFTIKRHFTVPRGPFEWLKDAPAAMPDWIPVVPLPAKSRRGRPVRYPLVNDELALLWMVEFGCVDLHAWTSRADRPDRPDWVLFDLDPAGVGFMEVVRTARLLHEVLDALGLEALVKTTGGEGLHVHVPLARTHTYVAVREFADVIARALAQATEDLVLFGRRTEGRRGVSIDTKMNGHGQQIVSVYSVRPRPGAPVATPVRWQELEDGLDPRKFTMSTVLARVERDGDLFAPLLAGGQRLADVFAKLG